MSKPTMSENEFMEHNRRMKEGRGEPCYESESEFQADAEKFLQRCGFYQRTIAGIAKNNGGRWRFHLTEKVCRTHQAPIMGDIVLMDSATLRYIEIELKNGDTQLSTEQSLLYKRNEIKLCRNLTEFESVVFEFMSTIKEARNDYEKI